MTPAARVLTAGVRGLLKLLCYIEDNELVGVPENGPLIIMVNHINFLEVPLITTSLLPREIRALTKKETWDNPFFRLLADSWGGIPIDRADPRVATFRTAEKALQEGKILFIAPEGTRTGDGILRQGHPGITSIALRTGAPILPVAHHGGERVWGNMRRLRRTPVTFRIGTPLRITSPDIITKQVKREITDQLMYELAALLPEPYRGHYSIPRHFPNQYVLPFDQDTGTHPI